MTEKEILQLITRPESDSDRVLRLAARHNADLPDWCARRRRRHRLVTDAVIAASIAAIVVVTALPDTDGHYISSVHTRNETLHTIEQTMIASI